MPGSTETVFTSPEPSVSVYTGRRLRRPVFFVPGTGRDPGLGAER
jgi:hypothetical protein